MNCDFIDLKQETINCKGVNFGNLSILFLLYLTGYWATWLPIVLYCYCFCIVSEFIMS